MKPVIYYTLVLLLLFLLGCGGKTDNFSYIEKYTVDTVDLKDVVVQTGDVQPIVKVDIKSEASGKIDSVIVKEGQIVSKGDLILCIDPNRLTFRKKGLDLTVKKAQLDLSIAQRNLDDAKKLTTTGTVTERQLFDLKTELEKAEITYQQQLLELSDITDQLKKTRVTSPMDGVVISLDVEEGEIAVSATSGYQGGTPLATIADIKKLEVISRIGEADYTNLHVGQKVIIRPEATNEKFTTGTINFIAMSAKKEKADELGTFEVRIAIDSLIQCIVPGINVTTEFVIMEKKGILGIPNHFVIKTAKGFEVLKQRSNSSGPSSINAVPISVGKTDYSYYELISGLKKGDIVVFKDTTASGGTGKK